MSFGNNTLFISYKINFSLSSLENITKWTLNDANLNIHNMKSHSPLSFCRTQIYLVKVFTLFRIQSKTFWVWSARQQSTDGIQEHCHYFSKYFIKLWKGLSAYNIALVSGSCCFHRKFLVLSSNVQTTSIELLMSYVFVRIPFWNQFLV